MNQKEAKVVREMALEAVAGVALEGFEFVGRGSEGAVFENEAGEVLVLRAIVKNEQAVAQELVAEFEAKVAKAEAKAKEKEAKVAKAAKAEEVE